MKLKKNKFIKKKKLNSPYTSTNFLKLNNMFFLQNYFINYIIKKINDHIIKFN